jgi:CYTH domain-containing protein
MGIEIERRFLIPSSQKPLWRGESLQIKQFYVDEEAISHLIPNDFDISAIHVWRIRSSQRGCFLTGKGRRVGAKAIEVEWKMGQSEFDIISERNTLFVIEKTRFLWRGADDILWEIDEFEGVHKGLIIAEVELESEDQVVQLPEWLGEEITGDNSWSNWTLSQMTKP